MLKNAGLKASFYQIKKILDICEYNPDYTINEVNKLLLYKIGDKELYDKDIDDVISKNNEKEMFNFTESIMRKDIKASLNSYKILISSDIDQIVLIDSIAKQFRLLLQMKILNNNNDDELARILGVKSYTIKKLREFIYSYSENDIADILYKLSEIDINIKIYGLDKNYLLESFLISI